MSKSKPDDRLIKLSLLMVALTAITVLAVITIFIFEQGLPIMLKYGLKNFLFGQDWYPSEKSFGLLPMIVGSLLVTLGALLIGVPLGLASAIFLTEFSSRRLSRFLKPVIELLAGIPSVVYGFLGLMFLVPFIRENLGGPGLSVLAASIILGIMILPTIISISIDSIRAVPDSYREGSIALGATKWQTVRMVVLPAARSGLVAGIILGMGRAIGETMAVIMVAGNAADLPASWLAPVRTLTSNIALEMAYASGEHRQALFATGVVLFVIIMILNFLANLAARKQSGR
ncbi:MAG TPA: phosphate ABC transporter permease subunit PstC [Candidatus Saccharicenans sp.]|nr:phosphate ABC transporter permease subunit PstC [Candidatus Saccharicenans sp.]HOL45846.1 phosphate ABC transporter permease subunit PstC [Candidatus Saccharicenans sp.]HOM94284.1 phosphate ABC transporter permease subunit PstC [Candidatus Saccharicenans sp.]HOP60697.1 phosphate ABC transporter permease subunit PstC [Candidatus Saccharicenans sp.]HOT68783.1 phosphate ABC transporter permease subunit PstC [Candidatus Saccharicenans sp.]